MKAMKSKRRLSYPPSMTAYNYKGRKAYEIFGLIGLGGRTWEYFIHMLHNSDSTTSVKFLHSQTIITLPHWQHRTVEENYGLAVQAYLELKDHADFT